jgi:dihydroorotate dehydrogenase electron transfer subunit
VLVIHAINSMVTENRQFPGDFAILIVKAPELALESKPGQFAMVATDHEQEIPHPLLKRALAVYRTYPSKKSVSFLIKAVGEGTRQLLECKPGDQLDIVGPLGNGFDLTKAEQKVNLLVVGGTGIASVYLLAEHLVRYGNEVHLLYGGRTSNDLIGLTDFEELDVPISVTTEDGSQGMKGVVTDALRECLSRYPSANSNIFTCGPNPMMKAVSRIAASHHIPCQLSMESKMACGFGVCLGCSVMTTEGQKLSCTEGPVFEAEKFLWEEDWEMVREK